jgi:hypothetical protein
MKRHLVRSFRRPSLGVALIIGALGLTAVALAAEKAPLRRLPAPEKANPTARAAIRDRMARHGNTMTNLMKAVVLLDRPTISTLALRIADEEVVARTEGGATEKLRAQLPKAFLDEQDQLRNTARALAVAVTQLEADTDLADRFGALARTCVTCHSVYLGWRSDPAP